MTTNTQPHDRPIERSYWVERPMLLAGGYPGAPEQAETRDKLRRLLAAGLRSFCDLTEATEDLRPYESDLTALARAMAVDVHIQRFGIRDVNIPTPEQMLWILDWIDGQIRIGQPVYVHCWGGIGRTGMVVGCWLQRHGRANPTTVLKVLQSLREGSERAERSSPETSAQRQFVDDWPRLEQRLRAAQLQRAQGCLMGQLAGDALGSLVEFRSAQSIRTEYPDAVRELQDGGTWNTIAGQPTDDSEMALALARSIVSCRGYQPEAAHRAYRRWLNSNPFDVGNTVRGSLSGHRNPDSQANGALMRVSPLGIYAARFPRQIAAAWAKADADLTHPHAVCIQANELFTMAIAEAIACGPRPKALWDQIMAWAAERAVEPALMAIIHDSRRRRPADYLHQAGWVLIALHNALYQLANAPSLEAAVVDTVMQGGDTDTNAAICGALLGAVYGLASVPERWQRVILRCRPAAGTPGVACPRPAEYWPVDALDLAATLLTVDQV